ncbi:MAG TPA: IPT/TIG domain-containing protein [Solirubrobacteraceae bacterium]|nr:IPT/TIG domain-containing protein [Solirubrobacteraceae bacterium]
MTSRVVRLTAPLAVLTIAAGAALLSPQAALARKVSPLPASSYAVRPACSSARAGHARCFALRLVPQTEEARAKTHPIGMTRSAPITAGKAAEGADGIRPQDLHSAYELPTTAASTQTIALIDAYNDPNAESNLKTYDEEFGLPACTTANACFKQLNQEGKTSPLPANEGGWSLEISLDIEVAHAVCQNCRILLVEAKSASYANLETAEDAAASAGATEISNSWGGEPPSAESAAFNHPGVVVTAAAGDDGYLNWDAPKRIERGFVNYPASSPRVVAVGGTRLELSSPGNTWKSEAVWNGQGATGGGCSASAFGAAPWQLQLSDWSAVGCGSSRAVSDVSADADPYTGAAVYDTTPYEGKVLGWLPVGGTSLATPLIAAVYALAGGADGASSPAETLYENELRDPGSFHDVTQGSNGECTKGFNSEGLSDCTAFEAGASCSERSVCVAGTGYDGPTGLGTPDGTRAFEPTPNAPTVLTEGPTALTQSSATLNATVNPNGANVSECEFEYGTSTAYGSSVPCTSSPGSGTNPVTVSAQLAGLNPNSEYHYRISATNTGGTSKGTDHTLTTLPNAPTVSGVSPDAGLEAGWTTVTITGTEFSSATAVQFGFAEALFYEVTSPTTITAVSPAGTGVADVTVTNPGGASAISSADQFSYVPVAPAPTIKKLGPKKGSTSGGTVVTLHGTGFVGVTKVLFGSTTATSFAVTSSTSITAVSPEAAPGQVELTVTTPNGTSAATPKAAFTFKAPKSSKK